MSRPVIGITGYHVRGEEGYGGTLRGIEGQGFSVVGHDYIQAVEAAGGTPVGFPVTNASLCEQLVGMVDGVVITGGEDVNPRLYGNHPDLRCSSLSPERDEFEFALIRQALRQDKPILCICRGLQLLNVYFGGTLHRDVEDWGPGVLAHQFAKVPRWYKAHSVKLSTTMLQSLYGAEEIEVNSYHHQTIKDLGDGLVAAGVAPDGIVEALQHTQHENLLAVQWHPEMMAVKLEEGLVPFHWLIERAQS